ncbi:hypothetical protein DYB30_008194 [Aphanomyces astaci]|uniref:Uncharacterized protein n=1 Tax=Aphanomyces astaci TaxID=112090 RepID=A0A397DQA7_APHAT|nr:hypothetical protein DYB30_008194 [Aphanomyces astaci]
MMMYAGAAPSSRHLRRRREDDDFELTDAFMHPTAFNSYSPTSCPQPHKKFKASLENHIGFMHQQTTPATTPMTWYDAADVSSPESDDMDLSMDVDMLGDDDEEDQSIQQPTQWNDSQVVQYARHGGDAPKVHATLEVVGSHAAQFKPHRPALIPSVRIEEVFDNEPVQPCNALVVYRPLPPAGSWKVEPESESDNEDSSGGASFDVVESDDMMEID